MSMTEKAMQRWLSAAKKDYKKVFCDSYDHFRYYKGREYKKDEDGFTYFIWEKDPNKRQYINRWADSTIKKFLGIKGDNPTCQKLLSNFNDDGWNFYKPQEQFHNWEYLCLLKLVWNGQLKVCIGINKGKKQLMFKNPRTPGEMLEDYLSK